MFIDQENKQSLYSLGLKIQEIRKLKKELVDFFIQDGNAKYESSQELLDVLNLHIRGENPDSIGESVFQTDGKPVLEILKLFGIIQIGDEFYNIKLNDDKIDNK